MLISNLNSKFYIPNSKFGFTLFEMLLAVSVFAIIGAISAPIFIGFKTRNDIDTAAQITASALRRASVLSRSMQNNSPWGVLATTSQVIIFSGAKYASRIPANDESFEILPSLLISGNTEIVFSKFTGMPTSTFAITLTSPTGETRSVNVNDKGMVNY